MSSSENQNSILPKGEPAPADYFTGTVWMNMLLKPEDGPFDCVINQVTFEAGARTNWHTHPSGQILICTRGAGYYQEKGEPIRLLHAGDVVKILPGILHWHGASADHAFTHIAVNPNTEKGVADWLEKVTDEEYSMGS